MDNDTVLKLLEDTENIQGLAIALNMLMLDTNFPLNLAKEHSVISALGRSIEEIADRVKVELEERVEL